MDSDPVLRLAFDLHAHKLYYVAISALLFYDYILTFADELHYAWTRQKKPVFFLFLINRYLPLCSCVIILFSYFLPQWTFDICDRFVPFEWIITFLEILVAEIILALRLYALTRRSKAVLTLLGIIQLAQAGLFLFTSSQPGNDALPTPDYTLEIFHVCILVPKLVDYNLGFLGLSLAFDSIVFGLTLYYTIQASRRAGFSAHLLDTFKRDGVLYFLVIFSGNLLWMIMVLHARPGLKFLQGIPSLFMTSIMINRLTLHLKKAHDHRANWNMRIFEGKRSVDTHTSSVTDTIELAAVRSRYNSTWVT